MPSSQIKIEEDQRGS